MTDQTPEDERVDALARAIVLRRYGIRVEEANPADIEDAVVILVALSADGWRVERGHDESMATLLGPDLELTARSDAVAEFVGYINEGLDAETRIFVSKAAERFARRRGGPDATD